MDYYFRFGDKVWAAKNDKRQTQQLEQDVKRGLVTSGPTVRKPYHGTSAAAGQNKPPSNNIYPSSFTNPRYSDRPNDSDHPPPFRNFGSGGVSPVGGGQLSANHPMLERSSKGPYYPTNKLNPEIMKRALR